MNENQDNAAQTGEDTPVEAPKKRRAPRKTVAVAAAAAVEGVASEPVAPVVPVVPVAVADEAAVAAPKKRRAPRKTAEASAPVEAAPAEVALVVEVAPVVAAVAEPEPAPAPVRAPRSRKKVVAEVVAPVETAEPLQMAPAAPVAPVAEPVVIEQAPVEAAASTEGAEGAAAGKTGEADASGTDNAEGGRRRGRDRDRKGRRERRGRDDVASAAAAGDVQGAAAPSVDDDEENMVEIVVGFDDDDTVDTGALFAEVVSGEYDAEVELAPEEEAEVGKRVLRPEPEAPKLHKVLAQAGIGSRREMEQLIEDGQVSVNGEPAHIGMRIAQGDQIRLAGRPIKVRIAPPPARVLAYHKVVGEVVTHHDPEGRPTVFRRLPRLHTGKWQSVGRLDINTEGLLLFTNSGDLANQLMHPRFGVEREYAVRVLGSLSTEQRARLLDGVEVEGQKAAFKSIEDGGGEGVNHWYRVVITEGRNREVRKLFDTVGLAVSRLIRIRYGTVVLPRGLKRGVWVELGDQDVRNIRQLAGNDQGAQSAQGQPFPGRAPAFEQADGSRDGRRDGQRGQGKKPGRGQGQGQGAQGQGPQGQGQGRDRDNQQPRSKGAQHGGDRGGDRQERQDRPAAGGRGGQPGGPQGNPGQNQRPQRGPRQDGGGQYPQGAQGGGGRGPRGGGGNAGYGGNGGNSGNSGNGGGGRQQDGVEDPLHIPNPLEQTFDKRFVSGSKRITTGFGRPTEEPTEGGNNRKGGPRQPDPMQTSVGYIGAEAYFTRPGGGNNKGRGGRRR